MRCFLQNKKKTTEKKGHPLLSVEILWEKKKDTHFYQLRFYGEKKGHPLLSVEILWEKKKDTHFYQLRFYGKTKKRHPLLSVEILWVSCFTYLWVTFLLPFFLN